MCIAGRFLVQVAYKTVQAGGKAGFGQRNMDEFAAGDFVDEAGRREEPEAEPRPHRLFHHGERI